MVIVLEMTGDDRLTLGVVMACAVAYFLYGLLELDTMYTVRLSRRGVRIVRGAEVRPLKALAVSSIGGGHHERPGVESGHGLLMVGQGVLGGQPHLQRPHGRWRAWV